MRNILFTLLLISFGGKIFGQKEKATYNTVANNFELQYNKGDYDSIFTMFSPEMQKALPLDKTTDFLTGLKFVRDKLQRENL